MSIDNPLSEVFPHCISALHPANRTTAKPRTNMVNMLCLGDT